MTKEELARKTKDFFNLLGTVLLMLFVGSVTFIAGYMLGLNRVSIPYLNRYIKVPEAAKVSTTAAASITNNGPINAASFLKSKNPYSTEAMLDRFKRFKFSPYNEARFNFSAILPVDWISVPPKMHLDSGSLMDNLNQHKDVQIALLQLESPSSKSSAIQAWALNVPADVDLDSFYRKYTGMLNFELLAGNATSAGRKHVLMRYKAEGGKTMLVRSVAVRSGEYIFYLNCSAAEPDFLKVSDMFNLAALSFTPEQGRDLEPFEATISESSGQAAQLE